MDYLTLCERWRAARPAITDVAGQPTGPKTRPDLSAVGDRTPTNDGLAAIRGIGRAIVLSALMWCGFAVPVCGCCSTAERTRRIGWLPYAAVFLPVSGTLRNKCECHPPVPDEWERQSVSATWQSYESQYGTPTINLD